MKKKYLGIGIRRKKNNQTLDVYFPILLSMSEQKINDENALFKSLKIEAKKNIFAILTEKNKDILADFLQKEILIDENQKEIIDFFLKNLQQSTENDGEKYTKQDKILFWMNDVDKSIENVEEAYLKLHLISKRVQKPRSLNLDGIFAILPNLAWTNIGPILTKDIKKIRLQSALKKDNFKISHIDKFPYLVDYFAPPGVRIVDGSRVRLGAYLGEGTTIMPAGFVNFNAGTLGKAMIEGRISAGVLVGHDSDLGGGASVMGTLSGGGKETISIGDQCLIGANAGVGISLGFGCTVEAGLYITASSKIKLVNKENKPVDFDEKIVEQGKNIFKAHLFSGREKILYYRDSTNGSIVAKPNAKKIALNPTLHNKQ